MTEAGSLRGRLLRRLALMLAILLDCWPARSPNWNARRAPITPTTVRLLSSARAIARAPSTMRTASLVVEVPVYSG